MIIIKNINNNFALAKDNNGKELIISGKGIGFGNIPREVKNLSLINRSYYDVDDTILSLVMTIPSEIIDISSRIVDRASILIEEPLGGNIIFSLADHIAFSIERFRNKTNVKIPIIYDIRHLYEKEYELGLYGLKLIEKEYNLKMTEDEASYIALHIINAEEQGKRKAAQDKEAVIEKITSIIESDYDIVINKQNFNYSRFVTHIYYLLKRENPKQLLKTDNEALYKKLSEEYPKNALSAGHVSEYLEKSIGMVLNNEEKLYLMLHINRLCTREDCNQ